MTPALSLNRAERWFLCAAVVCMATYYPTLSRIAELRFFQPGSADIFAPATFGGLFNSMLDHLLVGRFYVDPAAVGTEAFIVGDHTVAYFGIFCALLRLPLLPFLDLAHTDVTRLSCLAAICLGGWAQLRAVLLVRTGVPPSPRRRWLTVALVLAILLGGQQVRFLRPSVYQEAIDWGDTLAMLFIMFAVRGLLLCNFTPREMVPMAICAVAALLCRVTAGIGLYLALAGVLLLVARRDAWRRLVLPAGLLLAGAVACAGVNYARWGNPLVFADYTRYYLALTEYPDRIQRVLTTGEFNLHRLWFGALYYLLPIWAVPRGDGHLLFEAWQTRWLDSAELPPGTSLLDPLLIGLGIAFLLLARRQRSGEGAIEAVPALVVLGALTVPPLLLMTAISMAFRYQMEFYPPLVLAALLGFRLLCRAGAPPRFGRTATASLCAATVFGIVTAHVAAALYNWSPWGAAQLSVPQPGYAVIYGRAFAELLRQFGL